MLDWLVKRAAQRIRRRRTRRFVEQLYVRDAASLFGQAYDTRASTITADMLQRTVQRLEHPRD